MVPYIDFCMFFFPASKFEVGAICDLLWYAEDTDNDDDETTFSPAG